MNIIEMPKYSKTEETGDIGVDLVSLKVKRQLSWIFRELPKNDLGIDGQIEIVNENGEGTGRLIAVQIKTGKSYLKNEQGSNFIYYAKNEHLSYWLEYSLPVILILCDEQSDICYWVEISRTNIEIANKAWKVLVPKSQTLDRNSKNSLSSIVKAPQHTDIIELLLSRYLSDKYHKYSDFGRIDICPAIHLPRDFHYFHYMADLEKTSELIYVTYHYNLYDDFGIEHIKKYIEWRNYNINSCGHHHLNPKIYIFLVANSKTKLKISNETLAFIYSYDLLQIFRLLYETTIYNSEHFSELIELDKFNEEVIWY